MKDDDMIYLDKEKGVNPTMLKCPRCGKDTGSIGLIGDSWMGKCTVCGQKSVKMVHKKFQCPKCGEDQFTRIKKFDGQLDTLYDLNLCDTCAKEIKDHEQIVYDGGIYWKCEICHSGGVIKPGPYAAMIRKRAGVPAPNLCGVAFDRDDCPVCSGTGKGKMNKK